MAYTIANQTTVQHQLFSASLAVTSAFTPSAGNTLIAGVVTTVAIAATANPCVDTNGNTWVRIVSDYAYAASTQFINVFAAYNIPSQAANPTVTMTTAGSSINVGFFFEVAGGSLSLDAVSAAATGSVTPVTTNSVTTSASNEFLFALLANANNTTYSAPTNGFTIGAQGTDGSSTDGLCWLYNNSTTPGAYSAAATIAANQQWGAVVLALKTPGGVSVAWIV